MNDALTKVRTKMTKLEALFDDIRTPKGEADAAFARWEELAVKARRLEVGR